MGKNPAASSKKPDSLSSVTYTLDDGKSITLPAPSYYVTRESISLPYGAKGEQYRIEAWKTLCLTPAFREDIQHAQQELGREYWQQLPALQEAATQLHRHLFEVCKAVEWRKGLIISYPGVRLQHEYLAHHLADKWGLADVYNGMRWLVWLLEHWDVSAQQLPLWDVPDTGSPSGRLLTPLFTSVTAGIEYVVRPEAGEKDTTPRRAVIELFPGVSLEEARQVLEAAVQALGKSRIKGRPGLTDYDRALLRRLFEQHGLPRAQERLRMIRRIAEQMRAYGRTVSATKIGDELREWLKNQGERVRKYVSD
jgi:hypothetical protein